MSAAAVGAPALVGDLHLEQALPRNPPTDEFALATLEEEIKTLEAELSQKQPAQPPLQKARSQPEVTTPAPAQTSPAEQRSHYRARKYAAAIAGVCEVQGRGKEGLAAQQRWVNLR